MRQELDNATRLDRLIPIHEHLCQIDARRRFAPTIASSGLDQADLAALHASTAYGPLITALRRAESIGLDVTEVLRRAVHQSSLSNAADVAAVLHARVERLTSRATHRSGRRPAAIAGLITPAGHVSVPTLKGPLRELEAQIAHRVAWLADLAISDGPEWCRRLPQELVIEIVAYRELYAIKSQTMLGSKPSTDAHNQSRHYQRLKQLVDGPTPLGSAARQSDIEAPGRAVYVETCESGETSPS